MSQHVITTTTEDTFVTYASPSQVGLAQQRDREIISVKVSAYVPQVRQPGAADALAATVTNGDTKRDLWIEWWVDEHESRTVVFAQPSHIDSEPLDAAGVADLLGTDELVAAALMDRLAATLESARAEYERITKGAAEAVVGDLHVGTLTARTSLVVCGECGIGAYRPAGQMWECAGAPDAEPGCGHTIRLADLDLEDGQRIETDGPFLAVTEVEVA